jgi:hypothetical protein
MKGMPMAAASTCRASLLLIALTVAGCDAIDPYARPGVWTPSGANDTNLRAMVANPADLVQGAGETGAVGQPAADAVAAWRADHTKPLPAGDTAQPGQPPAGGGGGGLPSGTGGSVGGTGGGGTGNGAY